MTPRLSVFDGVGPQAERIASLWSVFLWISIVVWSVVVIALVAAAINKRAIDDRMLVKIVIGAGAATVVALFVLLTASIAATDTLKQIAAPRVLELDLGYDRQAR